MLFCDPYLPERRTVLTGRFPLVGDHVNIMHGQALCSDAAGEVIGRGEAGSARGRAGSASLVHASSRAATPNMKIRRAVATRARSMFNEDTILFFWTGTRTRVDEAQSRTLKKRAT